MLPELVRFNKIGLGDKKIQIIVARHGNGPFKVVKQPDHPGGLYARISVPTGEEWVKAIYLEAMPKFELINR